MNFKTYALHIEKKITGYITADNVKETITILKEQNQLTLENTNLIKK